MFENRSILDEVSVKLHLRDGRTDGRTDAANIIRVVCLSVGLSRVAATSTRRDGGDRGGRCCSACSSVRPSLRRSLTLKAFKTLPVFGPPCMFRKYPYVYTYAPVHQCRTRVWEGGITSLWLWQYAVVCLVLLYMQRGIIRCKPVLRNGRNYTKSIKKNSKISGWVRCKACVYS